MAVAVDILIDSMRRAVSPPGTDLFPNATDEDYLGYLTDAFWDARLSGLLADWTINTEEEIEPQSGTGDDITRDLMQILVLYGSIKILTNELRNLNTLFRAQAGPVEFEQQKAAGVLKDILAELQEERAIVLKRLSDLGYKPTFYIDSVEARTTAIDLGRSYYTG